MSTLSFFIIAIASEAIEKDRPTLTFIAGIAFNVIANPSIIASTVLPVLVSKNASPLLRIRFTFIRRPLSQEIQVC